MKQNDPIIEEVRKYRDQLAAEHHYDLDEIFRFIKERERKNKVGGVVPDKTPGRKQA